MEDDEVAAEKIMAKAIVADDIVVLMNIMILLGRACWPLRGPSNSKVPRMRIWTWVRLVTEAQLTHLSQGHLFIVGISCDVQNESEGKLYHGISIKMKMNRLS
eukprot:scaffold21159_cov72-Skeletonema_dohrnii-CCMP3373.AAC.1